MSLETIKFTRGVPPAIAFPEERLSSIATELLQEDSANLLQYGNGYGYLPLRTLIADQYHVKPENVVLGQGSLSLLDLLLRLAKDRPLCVGIQEPTYDRTITLLKNLDLQIVSTASSTSILDVEELSRKLAGGQKLDYLYVIPDFQNPTGSVMDFDIRQKLVNLARKFHFYIVEDAPYRHLRYVGEDVPSCFDFDPEFVIHMSSYSKLICPGLRVGFMILPEMIAKKLAKFAEDSYINCSFLNQAIVHRFASEGCLEMHISYLKGLYNSRRVTLLETLNKVMTPYGSWEITEGGFFVGLTLNADIPTGSLLDTAKADGLILTDGRGFFVNGGENFIRLPFCALNQEEITTGITRLQAVIKANIAMEF